MARPYTPIALLETCPPGGSSMNGAANTNPADVRAAADPGHPPAFGDVAVHYRTPTSQLHDALGGAINFREVALLVVARPIATFVDRFAEQPRGPQLIGE